MNERLMSCVENTLDQVDNLVEPNDLKSIVTAKNDINKDQRDAFGLSNTTEIANFNQIAIISSPLSALPKAKDVIND